MIQQVYAIRKMIGDSEAIPKSWVDRLARKDDIEDLADRLNRRFVLLKS